jgi:hypothetical protein
MTLNEVERLSRRIADLVDGRTLPSEAAKLAEDYALHCRRANNRLQQCAMMIQAGQKHQALELAETPPAVIDLAAALAFPKLEAWRVICMENHYAVPEQLDSRAIRMLNDLYAQGAALQPALYKEYRQAILLKQDRKAVDVLRTLLRLNPGDTNAEEELMRLQGRFVTESLERLARALAVNDSHEVIEQIEQIEAINPQKPTTGEIWERALRTRLEHWMERLNQLQANDRWQDALALINDIENQTAKYGLALSPPQAELYERCREWVVRRSNAEAEKAQFASLLAEFRELLGAAEESRYSTARLSLAQCRAQHALLVNKWQRMLQFQRPVPDELQARFKNAISLLQRQISARVRRTRQVLFLVGVLIAVAVVMIGLRWRDRVEAADVARALKQMELERRVGLARETLAALGTARRSILKSGQLHDAMVSTSNMVVREEKVWGDFEELLRGIAPVLTNDVSRWPPLECARLLVEMERLLSRAEGFTNRLAPEYLAGARDGLLDVRTRWNEFVYRQKAGIMDRITAYIDNFAGRAERELNYGAGPGKVQEVLGGLVPNVPTVKELMVSQTVSNLFGGEFRARCNRVLDLINEYANELSTWRDITNGLWNPQSLDGYLATLRNVAASKFSPPKWRHAATNMAVSFDGADWFAQRLLLVDQPAAWATTAWAVLRTNSVLSLYPARSAEGGERALLAQLRDDANIQNIFKYAVHNRSITSVVYAVGPLRSNRVGITVEGLVYNPALFSSALVFSNVVYRADMVESLGRSAEAMAYERVGLKGLLDAETEEYRRGLLPVLDALNMESEASPLFCAYVALQLYKLLDYRPVSWGAPWAPAVLVHRQRLGELIGTELRSGDWFVPERISALEEPLKRHFAGARKISYERQARNLHRLTCEVLAHPLCFVGYVNENREPVLIGTNSVCLEMWGMKSSDRQPGLVFRRKLVESVPRQVHVPMLFSPLFSSTVDRGALLKEIASMGNELALEFLPPFFAEPYEE